MQTKEFGDIQIHALGAEQRPLILIDGFAPQPQQLVAEAQACAFAPLGRFFPGVRAPFALQRFDCMMAPHQALVRRVFGAERAYCAIDCTLSLVTTPERELHALQRIPHIDTTDPDRLAVLVYLSGARFGGTGFFRHKSTGYEFIDASRSAAYNAALDADVAQHGPPAQAYVTGDTPLYEMIASFAFKPGRALIYSVQSLHSGLIQAPEALSGDPGTGRLTLNGFVSAA
jgi:hypothetical protein